MKSISFYTLWQREWQIKQQGKMQWLFPLVFFLLIVTLFPLAMGTEPTLLERIGVPVVWVACLLSLVIGMDALFRSDFDNGTLAQLVVAGASLPQWVLARLGVHWIFSAGIISLLSLSTVPLFAVSWQSAMVLLLSILVASPTLLMISAMASSLTLTIKNDAILVPLLALPLQLPVLIFATGAVDLSATGMNPYPTLALLLAGSIISVIIFPWIIAHVLKLAWVS